MYDLDHPRRWAKSIIPGLVVVFVGLLFGVFVFAAGMYFEHVVLVKEAEALHVR
jgi:hypothetical protein